MKNFHKTLKKAVLVLIMALVAPVLGVGSVKAADTFVFSYYRRGRLINRGEFFCQREFRPIQQASQVFD